MMNPFDSDRYTIQPIDRWNSTFFPVNQHNPITAQPTSTSLHCPGRDPART
ncbi:hypothetical protein C348_01079 [Cryptococcus neoformans Gb118]|nr:hypothetical protein C350_01103 [Cryptococcus neoformans var. grubii MW-RSA36]OXL10677.1 hypothetical protein C348_01079 [Cryptococcus neoformans var. grubii Gb118]